MTARVTAFKLHNICQYTDLSVDVRTGLNAVVGPNGSGKSNLCRALVYGLTGLVDGLWGTQQTLQKDGTADPGHVTVYFEYNSKSYTIRRHSASGRQFPDWIEDDQGSRVATRNSEVNAFMADVFGMPVRLMFQVCWARQGELAQLITAPAAIVSETLAQIFDTRRLEKIREKLKLQIDTIAVPPGDCKEKLKQWLCHPSLMADDKRLQAAADAARKERDELRAAYDAERQRVNGTVIQVASDELARIRAELGEPFEEATDEDREMVGGMDPDKLLDSVSAEIVAEETALGSMNAELRVCSSAAESAGYSAGRMQQTLDRLAVEVQKKPGDTCGFCKGEIKDIDKYIMEVCKAFGCLDITSMSNELKELRETQRKNVARAAELSGKIASTRESLERNRRLQQAGTRCSVERRRASLGERALELEGMIPDRDAPQRLRCMEAALQGAEIRLSKAEQELNTVLSQRDMARAMVDEMQKASDAYDRTLTARGALSEIRDSMSQSRAQARYLSGMVDRLNDRIGWFMRQTGLPFILQLSTRTRTFEFTNGDGSVHPAVHLSGAQRAMCAVAVQMALFSVMRPSMNLYVIDEPTEALDDSNKRVMAAMFARMNDMLPAVSGTMFIVTRDVPIIESCGNVIEVGGTTE